MSSTALFVRTVIIRDWRFLSVTIASCMVAATVATFQYSVFNSFRNASAVVPRALAADFWVKAGSVECFDFPSPFSEDYAAALARYLPNSIMRRVVFGFAPWRSPSGRRGNVAVVGIEGFGISPTSFIANESDLARLNIDRGASDLVQASISETTLALQGTVDTLPTYLGAPYILVDFQTARRLLHFDPTAVAFLAGNFEGERPTDFRAQVEAARLRFPEVSIASADDFAASSINYWQNKTGAGLAIGLAAILALLLMVLLMANGVLRFIQRYHIDLLSLLGHGATSRDVGRIVASVAAVIAVATLAATMVVTPLLVQLFKPLLPWAIFSIADLIAPLIGVAIALIIHLNKIN